MRRITSDIEGCDIEGCDGEVRGLWVPLFMRRADVVLETIVAVAAKVRHQRLEQRARLLELAVLPQ